jgi:hypothetical protein
MDFSVYDGGFGDEDDGTRSNHGGDMSVYGGGF